MEIAAEYYQCGGWVPCYLRREQERLVLWVGTRAVEPDQAGPVSVPPEYAAAVRAAGYVVAVDLPEGLR